MVCMACGILYEWHDFSFPSPHCQNMSPILIPRCARIGIRRPANTLDGRVCVCLACVLLCIRLWWLGSLWVKGGWTQHSGRCLLWCIVNNESPWITLFISTHTHTNTQTHTHTLTQSHSRLQTRDVLDVTQPPIQVSLCMVCVYMCVHAGESSCGVFKGHQEMSTHTSHSCRWGWHVLRSLNVRVTHACQRHCVTFVGAIR